MTTLPLALSLGHIAGLLGRARTARGLAVSLGDPFLVDLPPVGGADGGTIGREALDTLASLYFAAEVEATYLPAVAEQLALQRFGLNLTDRSAAETMETLAAAMRQAWVDRALDRKSVV